MLPLSNQALWASLNDTFTTMQAKKTVKSESLNEIINVRKALLTTPHVSALSLGILLVAFDAL